ncbi:MAG: radical SAM protein [Christensenellales bacterium]
MRYEGNIFRPPSEAYSLIVQATVGCSNNKCTFCSMYKDKKFHIRKTDDIIEDLAEANLKYRFNRIFLADGDALIIKTSELSKILSYIKENIPQCTRVGVYGSPKSMLIKSVEELKSFKDLGLGIVYTGLESGSDTVLTRVKKGSTSKEIISACKRVKEAGIPLSVTAISGLGGKELWEEHAVQTGIVLSEIKPEYIGLLTLMVEKNTELYEQYMKREFKLLSPDEVALETWLMLKNLDSEGSIFRSNHASNYLSLKGTLNADRDKMCGILQDALKGKINFKQEGFRAL